MLILSMVAGGVFAIDRAAKLLAAAMLPKQTTLIVIRGLLELRLIRNEGMALGLLSGNQTLILILPVLAVALGILVFRHYHMTGFTRVASGLILGGFLGNFVDRLLFGYVVDMLYFPFLPFFICNMADIAICAGVVMLAVSLLGRPQDWREKKRGSTEEDIQRQP